MGETPSPSKQSWKEDERDETLKEGTHFECNEPNTKVKDRVNRQPENECNTRYNP